MIRVYYLIIIIYFFFGCSPEHCPTENKVCGFVWKNHIIKDTSFGNQVITNSAFLSNETFRPPKKTTWNDFMASIWMISWILYCWLLIWIKRWWAEVTTRRPRFWRTPAILVGGSEFSSWQWYFGSSPPRQDATVDGKNPAPVEVGSLSHYLRALCVSGGARFFPSTVFLDTTRMTWWWHYIFKLEGLNLNLHVPRLHPD